MMMMSKYSWRRI